MSDDFSKAVDNAYKAAVQLWFASSVEMHAEGHPGIPGPNGPDDVWDKDRSTIEGAIITLQIILDRLYTKP